ncbi:AraC family transcriptional regulator [uncultured Thiodictyon sp.]|uniref:AraC family transcriptional regulator n=1 Tax=uncultured Thiodictyon sp. TaxID=1846217 RepID=UPI0025D88989|nr:AraC family transcriptional regulator [uncultured Thiodictyon sp.]
MAPLLVVPALLTEMGLDPGQLIAEARLDPVLFADPESTVAFADGGRFLALCASRTGCPHLGLLIGERQDLAVLGALGRLARHAPDLGTALRNIILFLHIHDRGAVPALWVSGDRALLGYTIYQAEVPGTEQIYDAALAIIYRILQGLTDPGWQPSEVCLCRPRPVECEPYRRLYRTGLRFGAEHNAVAFAAAWLDRPLRDADAARYQQTMQEILALSEQGGGDLVAPLRRVLRRQLVGGAGQTETSLAEVSKLFSIHPRTLNRRLRDQGTSFKALIDAMRYDMARQLLRDTRLPVAEIVTALDYSEPSAFNRAFRRWSGTTPLAWRAANAPV